LQTKELEGLASAVTRTKAVEGIRTKIIKNKTRLTLEDSKFSSIEVEKQTKVASQPMKSKLVTPD